LEWLRFVATLSEGHGPDVRATILKAIAQVFESAGGLLFLRGEGSDRYDLVDAWPGPLSAHPAVEAIAGNHEFITALRDRRWVIDLLEYRESPEFYQNLEVPDSLRSLADFRIISPLLATEGLTGFVMLREPPPPFDLTYEDRDLLVTLGRHVAVILSQQQAEWHLAEARQFEAYHRLTAFMMHDLKNLVAQLNLVVANSARHRANPAFIDDALDTVANAASRMSQLIGQLSRKQDADAREPVELGALVGEVVARCADREPRPVLLSSPGSAARAMTLADPVRLAAVLDHVIRNAQDASAPGSALELSLDEGDGQWRISIRDQGEGMTAEFVRTRLFRPFDSTKGAKGMGIGAYQVQEYIRMLGGDVEVQSTPGAGTTFVLRLPQHE
jgi:putative PEP-CTERM system histidine kinase